MATPANTTTGVVFLIGATSLPVSGVITETNDGIAVTSTDGLILQNTTAATVGVPVQQSPRLRLRSNVWDTDDLVNKTNDFWIESVPVSQAAPSGVLNFAVSLNGAATIYPMILTDTGSITITGGISMVGAVASQSDMNAGAGSFIYWSTKTLLSSPLNGQMNITNQAATAGVGLDVVTDGTLKVRTRAQSGYATVDALAYQINGAGNATSVNKIIKTVTAIADNSATTVLTATVPNSNQAAAINLTFLSSNGSTDAWESSRVAYGTVVIQRNSGSATAATAATLTNTAIATNATGGSATHTLAYSVALGGEGAGVSNTVLVQVTIDDSGNLGSNQIVVLAEVINAVASGVTIA